MNRTVAILLAGGSGQRFAEVYPKQFSRIGEKTILEHSLDRFENHPGIDGILLVENQDYHDRTVNIVKNNYRKIEYILAGGSSRQESSYIGVMATGNDVEKILIHDVARPLIPKIIIDELIDSLGKYPAVAPAVSPSDTVIEIDLHSQIKKIPDRQFLKQVQTPQAFERKLIQRAHQLAREKDIINSPDDCSLILKSNLAEIFIIEGSELNIKITYPLDLVIASEILQKHFSG
jgi:2-C-methyl-D-erythritol 4-phosphate cytidylyltransferase